MRYKYNRQKRPRVSKTIEIPAIDADQLMCTPISFDAIVEEVSIYLPCISVQHIIFYSKFELAVLFSTASQ